MNRPATVRLPIRLVTALAVAGLAVPGLTGVWLATAGAAGAAPTPRAAPAAPAGHPASTAQTSPPATVAPGSPTITLPSGPGTLTPAATTSSNQPLSGRAKAGAVLGGLLLIGLLWAFSQGYGLLGGRARSQIAARRDGPA